jgi:hypothetical protein
MQLLQRQRALGGVQLVVTGWGGREESKVEV